MTFYNEDEGTGQYVIHLYHQPPSLFPIFECGPLIPFCSSLGLLFSGPFLTIILDSLQLSPALDCSFLNLIFYSSFIDFLVYISWLLPENRHIWEFACLNISLFYFYAWLKMYLGVQFAKMKILFSRIFKAFFHITVKELWWKEYYVFIKFISSSLWARQPHFSALFAVRSEPWDWVMVGCGWEWCAYFRLTLSSRLSLSHPWWSSRPHLKDDIVTRWTLCPLIWQSPALSFCWWWVILLYSAIETWGLLLASLINMQILCHPDSSSFLCDLFSMWHIFLFGRWMESTQHRCNIWAHA